MYECTSIWWMVIVSFSCKGDYLSGNSMTRQWEHHKINFFFFFLDTSDRTPVFEEPCLYVSFFRHRFRWKLLHLPEGKVVVCSAFLYFDRTCARIYPFLDATSRGNWKREFARRSSLESIAIPIIIYLSDKGKDLPESTCSIPTCWI